MTGQWTLKVLVGLPVAAALTIACVVLGVWLWRKGRNADDIDAPILRFLSITAYCSAVSIVILAAVPGSGYYPYSAEYHRWEPRTGTVAEVSSRLLGGAYQRFVVRFEGDPTEYGCDDTRCSLVKPGDELALSCKRGWVYASTSGYGCRWVGITS